MKSLFFRIGIIFFFMMIFFSSCITNKQKLYLQEEDGTPYYERGYFEEYKLCVNDEIIYYLMTTSHETQYLYNMGVVGTNTSTNITYRIYEDGCVVLPTIGKVRIAGLTLREAERKITEAFKDITLDAEVKIAMSNNYFYVQGDGGKGQFYAYKENLNIFQALAMAGDISTMGDKSKIKIIRRGEDGLDHIEVVDLRKESIIESKYYYIKPNDVIYIPTNSNSFFRVDSFTGFVSLVVTPLSLVIMSLSFLKNN